MTIISDLQTTPRGQSVKGNCAHCKVEVYEDLWLLDDAYNVWMGRCPGCKALNYLSMNFGLRGYSRERMELVLPTEEEREANNLPADIPTTGKCGRPADLHGTPVGELQHRLREGEPL